MNPPQVRRLDASVGANDGAHGGAPEARRWSRRKSARPQELVAAALELFVERGYAATRLEDVAAAAGVSKGTVYLYFANKKELFKTVVRENLVPALVRGTDLVDSYEGSTPELLRELLRGWWGLIGATPVAGLTKLIMAESANFPDIARFYHEEVMVPGDELFARVLARGVARGEFRALPANPTTTLICAPLVFLMLWQRAFRIGADTDIDPEAFLDNLLQVLLFGLTAGAARDTPLPPQAGPYVWEQIRDEMQQQARLQDDAPLDAKQRTTARPAARANGRPTAAAGPEPKPKRRRAGRAPDDEDSA
ncbi:TetR/AcrR family transcriptional regulator [Cupriavidus gilardii]|uniref:TetR/AcrR family transcriptional regulator n=1 Tax=Cupriavidus gilardii TaxID=82541 RepID=UPI0021BE79F1|nr:TetR/AcrR family transcriptional regulator [Cupriavidus gilardii]